MAVQAWKGGKQTASGINWLVSNSGIQQEGGEEGEESPPPSNTKKKGKKLKLLYEHAYHCHQQVEENSELSAELSKVPHKTTLGQFEILFSLTILPLTFPLNQFYPYLTLGPPQFIPHPATIEIFRRQIRSNHSPAYDFSVASHCFQDKAQILPGPQLQGSEFSNPCFPF